MTTAVISSSSSSLPANFQRLQPQTNQTTTLTYTPSTLTCATPFLSLFQKCSTLPHLHQIHALLLKTSGISDPLLLTHLLFSSSFPHDSLRVDFARRILFSSVPSRDSTLWNSAIQGFCLRSMPEESLLLYSTMLEDGALVPDSYLFPSVLKACAMIPALSEGTQIHGCAIKLAAVADTYVQNALIKFYSVCGLIGDARRVFDKMSERSDVSWNCIVGGYAELGCWEDVKVLFWSMVEEFFVAPSLIVLVRMLTACTRSGDYDSGKCVHRFIEENGVGLSLNLGNALMNMYVKFGEMGVARQLFFQMPDRDVVSWTTLVSGYAGLGCLKPARELFDRMPERNVVTWNAMISGYVLNAYFKEANLLFEEMRVLDVKPDKATLVSVLSACVRSEDLHMGRMIHGYIEKVSIDVTLDLANSLLGMYSKCRSMDSAECLFERMAVRNEVTWTLMMVGYVKYGAKEIALEIFNKMPCKDAVSWNALIAAFSQCNHFNEALGLFQEMQRTEFSSNARTLVSILSACARVGALELGKWIHSYVERNNIEMDAHLGSSLIDMYAKCGCIELSLEVFKNLPNKDVLAWSTMIRGLAMHGHGKLALVLFRNMLDEGVQPDGITFVGVLSACSHGGLVDEGCHFFDLMTKIYGISPEIEHYSCMVDLLGRYDLLSKAKDFIENLSTTSNGESIWGAFLGACRIHGNVELAEYATNRLLELDPSNSGAYVLLSNVYANASQWNKVGMVRHMMKDSGVQKVPGCSSIEVNGSVHEFFTGDISHPQSKEIYMMLHEMEKQLESPGHIVFVKM